MPASSGGKTKKLSERFQFSDDSFQQAPAVWDSRLRPATGIEDRERYLVRLFAKTGTPIDEDLKNLIERGLRRIRRVLTSRRAREVLVEVLDVIEDEDEIGILMLDPGVPLLGSSYRANARRQFYMTNAGRKIFWQNMLRLVEGLTFCHEAGIVHGALSEHVIFSGDDSQLSYRLGGYETCIHISDSEVSSSKGLLRASGPISFRQDLTDLGMIAGSILGVGQSGAPILSSIEHRMLDRLARPPRYQLFDGHVVLKELAEVIEALDRIGSSSEGEFVLYPASSVLQSDLPSLASGLIPANDTDAVIKFASEDLFDPDVRVLAMPPDRVRIVTTLATYIVKILDGRIGMIINSAKRRADDSIFDATEAPYRFYLVRNRAAAEERVRNLGNAALAWTEIGQSKYANFASDEPTTWHALFLLEAFSLLRPQFRIFPVHVLLPPSHLSGDLVWVALRSDPARESRRKKLGLSPLAEGLKSELDNDEGRPDWTVSVLDTLGGGWERLPELVYETTDLINGSRAYGFKSSEPVLVGRRLFLRPRPDAGSEQAIKRRLQNIVAARTNVELLRALNDPTQVAMDDALRDFAAPGEAPDVLDSSKKTAWASISAGKSINIVVGPPGVGKSYLIVQLIKSILSGTPNARILISSQNHETLLLMEKELNKELNRADKIVVRVERTRNGEDISALRKTATDLLTKVSGAEVVGLATGQYRRIRQTLNPVSTPEREIAEHVFRDTENLLLRSSDITLASTSSHLIEEMIADGEQFDWVFVEEAARANGSELIGALLLGNRRVMIGDHRQLSPFEAQERLKFYKLESAEELLTDAKDQLAPVSDLPPEMDFVLTKLMSDRRLLLDVLGVASRLEEPFKSIADRENDRTKATGLPSSIVDTLWEQSRMHPAICELVSTTFYGGNLVPSERVKRRTTTICSLNTFPTSPLTILNLNSLSSSKTDAFEKREQKTIKNEAEAKALVEALKQIRPIENPNEPPPTLVIIAPYTGQVRHLNLLVEPLVKADGTLFGFVSPKQSGKFVFTSDSFQGGEADVVLAGLVRNNVLSGRRALGFVRNPQRMNVLLSRARQKLVLATSLQFLEETINSIDPNKSGGDLGFIRTIIAELDRLTRKDFSGVGRGATLVTVDENGALLQ